MEARASSRRPPTRIRLNIPARLIMRGAQRCWWIPDRELPELSRAQKFSITAREGWLLDGLKALGWNGDVTHVVLLALHFDCPLRTALFC